MTGSFSFRTIFLPAFILASAFLTGQESFTIKMSLKVEGMPPEYAAFAEADITNYIKGDMLKTERNGMMGSNVYVYDGKKMVSLNENMGNKFGFTATKEELEATGKDDKAEKPKIEYTAEKKMIAGYECTKVVAAVQDKDKKETKMVLWVTDKLNYGHPEAHKASGKGLMDLSDLKGYPLAMEMPQNMQGTEIKIMMTATEVLTTPINDSVFVLNTEGYTMMSYKEMQEKQKSMMGGR